MESHSCESSEDTRKTPKGYNAVQTPVLGLGEDESFPVYVPVRFNPSRIQDNKTLRSNDSGKEPTRDVSIRNLAEKDRHLSSRAYNPTPYYKSKHPFTAVTVQKSASTNAITSDTPNMRHKVIKEISVTGRKFKTAKPYRRPSFEDATETKGCQETEETCSSTSTVKRFPITRAKHIAATWPNTGMVMKNHRTTEENRSKLVSPRHPVPFRKATENTAEVSPKKLKPEDTKEFNCLPVTEISTPKSQLLVSKTNPGTHSQTNLVGSKDYAVANVDRYFKYLMVVAELIQKEKDKERATKNESYIEDQEVTVAVEEKDAESEKSLTEASSNDSCYSSAETDESSSEETISKLKIELDVCARNNYTRCKKIVTEVPLNILQWLFWFLKRYIFLTFVLIRIFQ